MATFDAVKRLVEEREQLANEIASMQALQNKITENPPSDFTAELVIFDKGNQAYKCSVARAQAHTYLQNNYNAKVARLSEVDTIIGNIVI